MKKYNFGAGPPFSPRSHPCHRRRLPQFRRNGPLPHGDQHRSANFQAVIDEARALVAELLQLPEDYSVIFLGGGASTQFCYVPYNLLESKAAYLNTGTWAKNALKEAKLFGEVVEVASSEDAKLHLPPQRFHRARRCGLLPRHDQQYHLRHRVARRFRRARTPCSRYVERHLLSRHRSEEIRPHLRRRAENLSMAGVTIVIVRNASWAKSPVRCPRSSTTARTSIRAACSTRPGCAHLHLPANPALDQGARRCSRDGTSCP